MRYIKKRLPINFFLASWPILTVDKAIWDPSHAEGLVCGTYISYFVHLMLCLVLSNFTRTLLLFRCFVLCFSCCPDAYNIFLPKLLCHMLLYLFHLSNFSCSFLEFFFYFFSCFVSFMNLAGTLIHSICLLWRQLINYCTKTVRLSNIRATNLN